MANKIWKPKLIFKNSYESQVLNYDPKSSDLLLLRNGNSTKAPLSQVDEARVYKPNETHIWWRSRHLKSFKCHFDLYYIPFDNQICNVQVRTVKFGYSVAFGFFLHQPWLFSTAWGSRYWAEFQSINRVGFETVHETYSQQVYCDWLLYANSTKWDPLVHKFAENIWSLLDVVVYTFNLPDSSSWGVTFHRWITFWGFDYGVSNFKPCNVHIVQCNSGRFASSFESETTRYLVASWTCYANGCFLNSGYKWACEYKAKLHQSGRH